MCGSFLVLLMSGYSIKRRGVKMNKLFLLSISLVGFCLIPGSHGQLPWANLNEFLAAIRNFNLFQVPPLNVADPQFQQYAIITNLFRNRRGCPGGRVFTECYKCDIPCSQRNGPGCDDLPCQRGCGCARGYFVNARGFCVPEERCELVEPNPTIDGGDGICPGGRVYSTCARCDLLCTERTNPPPCNDRCRPGCSCPNNYYLNADGNCVTADRCGGFPTRPPPPTFPPTRRPGCPGGRVFTECYKCDIPCSQRNGPGCDDLPCQRGCGCARGYFVNARGFCVPEERCELVEPNPTIDGGDGICPGGRVYSTCARCDLLCTERTNPPPCNDRCRPGCSCPNNYYLNADGNCVTADRCGGFPTRPPPTTLPPTRRPVCRGNREYIDCATCDIPCSQRNNPPACTLQCRRGCACPQNYYLNQAGVCVRRSQCQRPATTPYVPRTTPPYVPPVPTGVPESGRCPQNQVYDDCITCIYTCEERFTFTPDQCQAPCRQGCHCNPNEYLNEATNRCVRPDQCPGAVPRPTRPRPTRPRPTRPRPTQPQTYPTRPVEPICYGNQIYDSECVRCERTCENVRFDPRACTEPCRPGCRCPSGLILNGEDCVREEQCPDYGPSPGPRPGPRPGPGQCPGNQIYDAFCVRCVVTCENRLSDRRGCSEPCRQGCRCPDGLLLLRGENTEQCVYVNDCPPDVGLGGSPSNGPSNECGECVNGRCVPDLSGRLYCYCDQGYTGVSCDEQPLFGDRRCGNRCIPPRRCRFGGAQSGYICA